MLGLALDLLIAALVIGVALWTVRTRDDFAAIVGFVAYGLLLTLAWARLAAYDVALTEAAIGGGVTGVILLRASIRLKPVVTVRKPISARILVGLLCAAISAGLSAVVLLPMTPAPSLATEVRAHLAGTGLGNPIAGVLMAYRALDTFLETVVVLLALFGVWSLTPDAAWGGRPVMAGPTAAFGPLPLFGRVLIPVGIVIGIYIVWVGADAPGGKFQGATILAAMWILAMMAGLTKAPPIGRWRLRLLLAAGPIVFVAVGLAGIPLAGAFLAYPEALAKPLILLIEVALTLSIAATLGLLVAGPPETASGAEP
ncbi:MAG TPA: hydrogenase subunit MbhD domain-containing protein [Kaistia sp.]|nr:hydrogenase subunit MbhD domain-containing protein [Kaistia sp.]